MATQRKSKQSFQRNKETVVFIKWSGLSLSFGVVIFKVLYYYENENSTVALGNIHLVNDVVNVRATESGKLKETRFELVTNKGRIYALIAQGKDISRMFL